jgi:hypothetical protein
MQIDHENMTSSFVSPICQTIANFFSPGFSPLSIPINDASPQDNISELHFPYLQKQTQNTPQHGLRTPLELPLEDQVATSSSSIPTMLLASSIQSFTTEEVANEGIKNGAFELAKDLQSLLGDFQGDHNFWEELETPRQ